MRLEKCEAFLVCRAVENYSLELFSAKLNCTTFYKCFNPPWSTQIDIDYGPVYFFREIFCLLLYQNMPCEELVYVYFDLIRLGLFVPFVQSCCERGGVFVSETLKEVGHF